MSAITQRHAFPRFGTDDEVSSEPHRSIRKRGRRPKADALALRASRDSVSPLALAGAASLGSRVPRLFGRCSCCVTRNLDSGPAGLSSDRRGKLGNRVHKGAFRDQVLDIVRSRYAGFRPALAHEKLLEQHGFGLLLNTLGGWTGRRV